MSKRQCNPDRGQGVARVSTTESHCSTAGGQGGQRGQGCFPKIAGEFFLRCFRSEFGCVSGIFYNFLSYTLTTLTTLTKPWESKLTCGQGSRINPGHPDMAILAGQL